MSQDNMKKAAADEAMSWLKPHLFADSIVGVGTGSTVNFFIDALAKHKFDFKGAVASSEATEKRLREHNIEIFDLNSVSQIEVYVDGADEINANLDMIKGGGAALTREKIVAAVSKTFVCIADKSKQVDVLGRFPLPVEVIPMARSYVARELVKLGGNPVYREGVITDNGNQILDVHDLNIDNPASLEEQINQIVGVVTNGLFANRGADILMLATADAVERIEKNA